jgi:hypothetical protein
MSIRLAGPDAPLLWRRPTESEPIGVPHTVPFRALDRTTSARQVPV